jgi:protein-S-isoprenylcysteine O-methyltransferase Ste14
MLGLTILCTILLLGSGTFMIYDALVHEMATQSVELVTGAVVASLGLFSAYFQGRMALKRTNQAVRPPEGPDS